MLGMYGKSITHLVAKYIQKVIHLKSKTNNFFLKKTKPRKDKVLTD